MNGRRIAHARGKVLGGSSSINGMIFQRGNPLDYERWGADPGMQRWNYAHCLPYFKTHGNLPCRRGCLARRRRAAAARARPGDQSVVRRVFPRGANRRDIRRPTTSTATGRKVSRSSIATSAAAGVISAARAYLHPVMGRTNLTVRTLAHATRIVFEGKRAVGVEYVQAGRGIQRSCVPAK